MDNRPASLGDGRYEPLRRIGQGGSGQVWLARDLRLDRDVAIKRIPVPGHLPDDERAVVRERIRREARAAARIDHPGVAPLFDIVVDDDAIDLVMAYLEAPDLSQLVRERGPLDDATAAELGLQVLEVLEAAHAVGVVHRDVKPGNVLVGPGTVHLTDFGIAALADETAMTRTGTTLGSPGYVAPEQAEGRPAAPEADLWGLGALLYHAVTGRPPFDRGRPIATMHAVVHDEPDPIGGQHVLAPLIGRLLQKDPAARPSAAMIRPELERIAASATAARDETIALVAATPTRRVDAVDATTAAVGGRDVGPRTTTAGSGAPPRRPQRRSDDAPRGLAGVLLAAAVLAVVGGVGWALLAPGAAEDGTNDPAGSAAAPATTAPGEANAGGASPRPSETAAAPAPGPPPTPEDDAEPDAGASAPPDAAEATVPEGWETYEGATYTVAHPPGWSLRPDDGNRVDLVDPETGAYLRMDWTNEPESDPVADWERQSEGFARRHEDYEEIRIEPVDYRGWDAALWEYEYSEAGGRFHAYNLGLTTGERGYALNFQTPASAWDDLEELFEGFTASFRPHG